MISDGEKNFTQIYARSGSGPTTNLLKVHLSCQTNLIIINYFQRSAIDKFLIV